ncbi:DNA lyase [Sulfodiicoccus acidiphilus]|uniref:8-oxoguanine DNA glycosylase/AP lyase n=1 Tax=Sulfodiicoccus acidiphilus TaxID=1670455 RepID=A0A348B353_9CREN|nr:N-glycosylase/DNA lyase [Sulfodiicoccus acidiphilus]BBD72605.1 DNA lyase [Sulfodiicoccus acidiphilus]GGT93382.1 DNA lyase [Sulfodiicoccus acidiphilus]
MLRGVLRNAELRAKVLERAEEFRLNNKAGETRWFKELVLCILTANSSFESAYRSLQEAWETILDGSEKEVSLALKESGYRFPNLKARYIVGARGKLGKLKRWIKPIADRDQFRAREELLVIDGIGMKEASHFLRNVGYFDLAIIDRHILHFLRRAGAANETKITPRNYWYLEGVVRSISSAVLMPPGLLDLYLWYLETSTILK